jgi:hypothetical protein
MAPASGTGFRCGMPVFKPAGILDPGLLIFLPGKSNQLNAQVGRFQQALNVSSCIMVTGAKGK